MHNFIYLWDINFQLLERGLDGERRLNLGFSFSEIGCVAAESADLEDRFADMALTLLLEEPDR